MPKLSWKPVRRSNGEYCSPACGARCTWKDYQKAKKAGAALAKRIGKGWTFEVWENLGWNFRVISPCGRVKIHRHTDWNHLPSSKCTQLVLYTYTAFLSPPGEAGGLYAKSAKTPEQAIKLVVREGRKELRSLTELLEGL